MTPAEFRCLREYLGLSTQWVATRLKVNPRTVVGWESPDRKQDVPFHASQILRQEAVEAEAAVEELSDWIDAQELGAVVTVPGESTWHSGEYPPSWYRVIAQRAIAGKRNMLAIEYEE